MFRPWKVAKPSCWAGAPLPWCGWPRCSSCRPCSDGELPASTPVVVLGTADQRIAFAVDAVLDEQEVLVKRLGKPLARVQHRWCHGARLWSGGAHSQCD
ncbi:chemotaxis protein CheW [Polaromonas sp. P1(28)-13]|nr:chemotaxis protein CheW [Polaromonas sp. P1(28)-13]